MLTASPSGEWFSVVHPADLSGGTLQGASGVSGNVSGDAIVGTWIVQLTRESLANVQNPSEVEVLLDGFGADMTGMGMQPDAAWTALTDSIKADLGALLGLTGAELRQRVKAHSDRVRRLLEAHNQMTKAM